MIDPNSELIDARFKRVDEKLQDLKDGIHEKLDSISTVVGTLATDQKKQYNHITEMQRQIFELEVKHDTCRIGEVEKELGLVTSETSGFRFIAKNIRMFVYSFIAIILLILAKDGATFIGWVKKVIGL